MKRACIKSLPPCLVIHLKRYDFDYETMQRLKLRDAFAFPRSLDMRPYTVEGVTQADRESERERGEETSKEEGIRVVSVSCGVDQAVEGERSGGSSEALGGNIPHLPRGEQASPCSQYSLVGVVVHSGTAFAGHYYSFIRRRRGDAPMGRLGDAEERTGNEGER